MTNGNTQTEAGKDAMHQKPRQLVLITPAQARDLNDVRNDRVETQTGLDSRASAEKVVYGSIRVTAERLEATWRRSCPTLEDFAETRATARLPQREQVQVPLVAKLVPVHSAGAGDAA